MDRCFRVSVYFCELIFLLASLEGGIELECNFYYRYPEQVFLKGRDVLSSLQSECFYREYNYVIKIRLLFSHKHTNELYNELAYVRYHFCEIYLRRYLLWMRRRCAM